MTEHSITICSQNVFQDLGFSPQESENLRLRSELMAKITDLIQSQNWTIDQSANYLGEAVEVIEALHRGKIGRFSIEQLVSMLTHAGMSIHIEVLPMAA
jgi:predicted XRE-type DNA-binding protein